MTMMSLLLLALLLLALLLLMSLLLLALLLLAKLAPLRQLSLSAMTDGPCQLLKGR